MTQISVKVLFKLEPYWSTSVSLMAWHQTSGTTLPDPRMNRFSDFSSHSQWKWEITQNSCPRPLNVNAFEKRTFLSHQLDNRLCPMVAHTIPETGFKVINKWSCHGKPPHNATNAVSRIRKLYLTFFKVIIAFIYICIYMYMEMFLFYTVWSRLIW